MFNLVLGYLVLLPLIGLWRVEAGAFGPDIGQRGAANGASLAYIVHAALLYLTYILILRIGRRQLRLPRVDSGQWLADLVRRGLTGPEYSGRQFRRLAWSIVIIHALTLLFLLFLAGAWRVVIGEVQRGVFRGSFGPLGPFAYFFRDFLTPAITALAAFVYVRCPRTPRNSLLLVASIVGAAANAAVWGYRSSVVFTLIPAALFLAPRVGPFRIAVATTGALATMMAFSMYFDGFPLSTTFTILVDRATIGTANSAWKVWDIQMIAPGGFPPYAPTLLAALGGRLASGLGIQTIGNLDLDMFYDYSTLLTVVAKAFVSGINPVTSSVTGTVFAEGVIALGAPGFVVFSLAAGTVTAFTRLALERATWRHRPAASAIVATYFLTSVVGWLNSGGVTVLFMLPFVIYYGLAYAVCRLLVPAALRASTRVPRVGVSAESRISPGERDRSPDSERGDA
jgi:hypothetical protein